MSYIGSVLTLNITERAINSSSDSFLTLGTLELKNESNSKRKYILDCHVIFSLNPIGDRMLMMIDAISTRACETFKTNIGMTKYVELEPNSIFDIEVKALQNSGGTISIQGYVTAICIK